MSESSDKKKQVRLEADVYDHLRDIQVTCQWPVTLQVLANFAIRHGLGMTKRTFNRKIE